MKKIKWIKWNFRVCPDGSVYFDKAQVGSSLGGNNYQNKKPLVKSIKEILFKTTGHCHYLIYFTDKSILKVTDASEVFYE